MKIVFFSMSDNRLNSGISKSDSITHDHASLSLTLVDYNVFEKLEKKNMEIDKIL